MPMLDVSAALTNPYTLDKFTVYRRKQYVNNFGETKISCLIVVGVPGLVWPDKPDELRRGPDVQVNPKTITIATRFPLRGMSVDSNDNGHYQPDLILWRNNFFLAKKPDDYTKYLRGHVIMTAESIDMEDQAPLPVPLSHVSPGVSLPSGYSITPYSGGSYGV